MFYYNFTTVKQSGMKIKSTIVIFLLLSALWIMLTWSLQASFLVTGLVTAFVIAVLFCRSCHVFDDWKITPKSFFYTLIYFFVFLIELFKSNLDVARRVLTPSLPIKPGIVEVKTKLTTPMGRLLLANSITLTPGTLSVEIAGDTLFIHWIEVCAEDSQTATEKIVRKFEKYLEVIYG
jgi:multicomponent Na+:H+ antiporter subunit E